MANRAGHDGTDFESAVRNYLAEQAGIDVRREVKHGSRDEGDLHATIHGHSAVIECKRVERVTPKMMASYRLQTVVERDNAGADIGILVTWVPGKGFRYSGNPSSSRAKNFGDNVAHMTVATLLLVSGACGDAAMPDHALDTWVSMSLCDLALMARDWGETKRQEGEGHGA